MGGGAVKDGGDRSAGGETLAGQAKFQLYICSTQHPVCIFYVPDPVEESGYP